MNQEAVADAWQSLDVARRFGIVAERHSQLPDDRVEAAVEIDDAVWPKHLHEAFARHDLPGLREQFEQHRKRLRRQPDHLAIAHELPGARVERPTIERNAFFVSHLPMIMNK